MALTAENDQSSSEPRPRPTPPTATSRGARPRGKRGPKTAAGKEKVSVNAVTNGLTSVREVLPGESRARWEAFREHIIDDLGAGGPVAKELAEGVAFGFWRRRRLVAYQLAVLDERQHLEPASARLLPGPLDLDKIIRYEAHINRLIIQGLHELEAMRAERDGKPTSLMRVDVNNETGALPDAENA